MIIIRVWSRVHPTLELHLDNHPSPIKKSHTPESSLICHENLVHRKAYLCPQDERERSAHGARGTEQVWWKTRTKAQCKTSEFRKRQVTCIGNRGKLRGARRRQTWTYKAERGNGIDIEMTCSSIQKTGKVVEVVMWAPERLEPVRDMVSAV